MQRVETAADLFAHAAAFGVLAPHGFPADSIAGSDSLATPGTMVLEGSAPGTPGQPGISAAVDMTPECLKRKEVSPGVKDDPLHRTERPAPVPVPEPVVGIEAELRGHLSAGDTYDSMSDRLLRVMFDYDAVYGVLGSDWESVDAAVFAIFEKLFRHFGQEGAGTLKTRTVGRDGCVLLVEVDLFRPVQVLSTPSRRTGTTRPSRWRLAPP